MRIELDHLSVPAKDRKQAAALLASLLGVPWAEGDGAPFSPVYVSDSLTLDFDQAEEPFPIQHYCFRMSPAEFAQVLVRLESHGIAYRSMPHGPADGLVNTQYGGQLVYWSLPDGHIWEALTESYARQPKT